MEVWTLSFVSFFNVTPYGWGHEHRPFCLSRRILPGIGPRLWPPAFKAFLQQKKHSSLETLHFVKYVIRTMIATIAISTRINPPMARKLKKALKKPFPLFASASAFITFSSCFAASISFSFLDLQNSECVFRPAIGQEKAAIRHLDSGPTTSCFNLRNYTPFRTLSFANDYDFERLKRDLSSAQHPVHILLNPGRTSFNKYLSNKKGRYPNLKFG